MTYPDISVNHVDIPWSDVPPDDDPDAASDPRDQWGIIGGGAFILDEPDRLPAVWGRDTEVLWAEGEALMVGGPQGVGKTTLVGQLVRALLGLGDGQVLGLPVKPINGKILYLAMDRPRQIARSMARQFTEADRPTLDKRLMIRRGPPPADLAARPELLAAMAHDLGAEVVFVDSVKDAALGLSNDEVGAAYNRARQHLLAGGRQIVDIHHTKKRDHQKNKNAPLSIDDVYGSTWLTAGCGSVILLNGAPGDPIVEFRHIKQPADEVGPWRLLHNQTTGDLTVEHSTDLVALIRASGADGLTAKVAAVALFGDKNPNPAAVAKARRKLEKLANDHVLTMLTSPESNAPNVWFLAAHQGVTEPYEK